jgi:hypothetical protein
MRDLSGIGRYETGWVKNEQKKKNAKRNWNDTERSLGKCSKNKAKST